MATTPDKSGNSAVGLVPHIPSKDETVAETLVAIEETLEEHTVLLTDIEENTTPA